MIFVPKRVFIEEKALEYPLGKKAHANFKDLGIPIKILGGGKRVSGVPGKTDQEAFLEAKRTLVIGIRKTLSFQSCKPSAHYQLPITSSCTGRCEYCYLMTNFGKKPYVKAYVNLEEILDQAEKYIKKRQPELTVFEGSATSDPVPVERYTGVLARCIEFFGKEKLTRFRFVTKFTDIDGLLGLEHRNHTTFRFSINTREIIRLYEHGTPRLDERLEAAAKAAEAGYPLGFIIGPIFIYPGWEAGYQDLINLTREKLPQGTIPAFELITHRFTARAKKRILEVFPKTSLPLEEKTRKFKYGQFGYGKYLYPPEDLKKLRTFLENKLAQKFSHSPINYFV